MWVNIPYMDPMGITSIILMFCKYIHVDHIVFDHHTLFGVVCYVDLFTSSVRHVGSLSQHIFV